MEGNLSQINFVVNMLYFYSKTTQKLFFKNVKFDINFF